MPPSGRLPCYAKGSPPRSGVIVGYRISDARTNRVRVLLPSMAVLDDHILEYLHGAQLVLVDGIFCTDDELHRRQRGAATVRREAYSCFAG
jgi:hypothetical protein